MTAASAALTGALLLSAYHQISVDIETSDMVDVARMIAHDEGFDVGNHHVYTFEIGPSPDTMVLGYTAIGFYINGSIANTIIVSKTTGQAMDMNGCEIFDYPDLKPFQDEIVRITKAKRKTPQQMAKDAECENPQVLTKPIAITKLK
ncbi:MAG: hypothetical protein WCA78_08930 [Rhizomicrobium sp.]